MNPPENQPPVRVGILILNYHQPEATVACVKRLLEVEGGTARILWLENDADVTLPDARAALEQSGLPWVLVDAEGGALPGPGQIGLVPIAENLGYAGGNNVGLRLLHRHGVAFAWVMNNDTLLVRGSSEDLVQAAEARPEVGLWGMWVSAPDDFTYIGLHIQMNDFGVSRHKDPAAFAQDPTNFVNGCAMFMRTAQILALGAIPEEYFMYYEDQAFSMEIRRHQLALAVVETVDVHHIHGLSTGKSSRFTQFYMRRNRWLFISRYFPEHLRRQVWIFFTYQMQKLFFRLAFARIRLELRAYLDFKAGRLGRAKTIP